MTVTIGAICEANSARQTGSIVLCADTLISYMSEDGIRVSSNPSGGKLFDLPMGFYAATSGDIARCNQIVGYLHQRMTRIPPDRLDRVGLVETAISETAEYVRCWMRQEVLSEYNVSLEEFLHDDELSERYEIRDDIKRKVSVLSLIIAGFSTMGCPTLLYADFTANPRPDTRFTCAGSGGSAALDWLNMRGQNSFMSVPRTVYHVHEAKRFAERSPVVGKGHQMLLLRHNQPMVSVGGDRDVVKGWLAEYQPRDTGALDSPQAYADFARAYEVSDLISSSAAQT